MSGYYAFDLDGTLAEYTGWVAADHIGAPIPAMVDRVKKLLAEGQQVKIFTARVWPIGTIVEACTEYADRFQEAYKAAAAIEKWCVEHIGVRLPITCVKDYSLIALFDDRAIEVVSNTGMTVREVMNEQLEFYKTALEAKEKQIGIQSKAA